MTDAIIYEKTLELRAKVRKLAGAKLTNRKLPKIAAELGIPVVMVRKLYNLPLYKGWQLEARELRAAGASIKQLCEKFGKHRRSIDRAVQGIKCPVDHAAIARRARKEKPRPSRKLLEPRIDRSNLQLNVGHDPKPVYFAHMRPADAPWANPAPVANDDRKPKVTLPKLNFLD